MSAFISSLCAEWSIAVTLNLAHKNHNTAALHNRLDRKITRASESTLGAATEQPQQPDS
jgi:hypothetical protein